MWLLRLAPVAALAWSGCGAPPSVGDADRDGVPADRDCDDDDPDVGEPFLVYPDADGDGAGARVDGYPACTVPPMMSTERRDCDDQSPEVEGLWMYPDADEDGFGAEHGGWSCAGLQGWTLTTGDCDDADPGVHPGVDEVCNAVDDDCDGIVDPYGGVHDGVVTYADADGDGWGDLRYWATACELPEGRTLAGGDCDDADPTVNPAMPEICNGRDDDCDYRVDPDGADGAPEWFSDADGDGWGVAIVTRSCEMPDLHAPRIGDCDDADRAKHPHAAEACTGDDLDCDGHSGEEDPDLGLWYVDADGDGAGDAAITERTCTPPADAVAVGGDCDDADPSVGPLAEDVCGDGVDQDCSGRDCARIVAPSPAFTFESKHHEWLGSVGDVDGDGVADALLVSGQHVQRLAIGSGSLEDAGTWVRVPSGEYVVAFAGAGDLDGDGPEEAWVFDAETVYLRSGGRLGLLQDDEAVIRGLGADAGGNSALVSMDWDEDERLDLVVAAGRYEEGLELRWFPHPASAAVDADDASAVVRPGAMDHAQQTAAAIGDASGDGRTDLAWGLGDAAGGAGAVYVFTDVPPGDAVASDVAHLWYGAPGDGVGTFLAAPGDVDEDGYADLVVGGGREVDLFLGPIAPEGRWDAATRYVGARSIWSLAVDDLDQDGRADLVVGDASADRVWIVRGPAWGIVEVDHDAGVEGPGGNLLGTSVTAGDFEGDGSAILLVVAARSGGALWTTGLYGIDLAGW